MRTPKRAICLAGGGPVAGLHIGALEALKNSELKIAFESAHDVWALSCIGAWVGVVYNQFKDGDRAQQTYDFFHDNVFRDDPSFESFPINKIFGPDWTGNADALKDFLLEPGNYRKAFSAKQMVESAANTLAIMTRKREREWKWNEGNFNNWMLNDVMAVNPLIRFWTSMIYKSNISGLTKLYFPDSDFLKKINFDNLIKSQDKNQNQPFIFHNAWNLTKQKLKLFCNDLSKHYTDDDGERYKQITAATVCACSALPFIEQTVKIGGDTYCEGALVDTVNFKNLLRDHGEDLDEIWINRIVDAKQIREPKNLYDSLANLCELFAATVGEDDVALFKKHVRETNRMIAEGSKSKKGHEQTEQVKKLGWKGIIVEIRTSSDVTFDWSHKNLARGRESGAKAAYDAVKLYKMYNHKKEKIDDVLIIPDDLTDKEITDAGLEKPSRDETGRIVHAMRAAAPRARA
jgi:predicted acylesterase/phospholipase RssA